MTTLLSKTSQSDKHQDSTVQNNHHATARLSNLDAIRGFALLGILFINIYFMGNVFYGYAPHKPQIASDIIIEVLSNIFVEGRFITLFSMLFGVGLYLQCQKVSTGQLNIATVKSRLKWLMVFGLVHGVLLFSGDILFTYGLCGFLALCYVDYPYKKLLTKAALFITIALTVIALVSLTLESDPYYRGSALFEQELKIWTGPYLGQLQSQAIMIAYMALVIPLTLLWYNSALMLIGIALFKQQYFSQGFTRRQLLLMLAMALLMSGADTLLGFSSSVVLQELSTIFMMLGAIPMAMIYLHIIVKLGQYRQQGLVWLQQVGRLSLSLYILQSVVGVILLRHLFPQWQLNFDRWQYLLVAMMFTVVQIAIAHFYLKHVNQGPLEAIWRKLSAKNQAILKSKPSNQTI
ncbi:DUF418 domain-containing protein [Shewanella waksmanii]|uniref:DUF418 domain-containing protein n=1 Tax=Shewanella waksmanii TaxID=213783 RepID=UPI00373670FD